MGMSMTAITPVQLQPQSPLSVGDAVWQVMLGDPTFLALNIGAILLVCILVWIARTRYARFYRLQREAIDHRKRADAQVLAHNESFEQLISQQYGTVNAHNQQLLAKADEAHGA